MRLRILDKYVLKELLYPFLFGIGAFSSIIIASTMLYRITQYITKYGASLEAVGRLFVWQLPEIVNYTFPMSMLLAALMAFGKLSGSSEIVAMKASGISYHRIVAPVLVVGFLVSMFSAITVTRNFMHLLFDAGSFRDPKFFRIKESYIQKNFEAEDTKREKAKFGVLD